MLHAAYFRAQAELCLGIARSLNNSTAANKILILANDYARRAEEIENDKSEKLEKKIHPIGLLEQRAMPSPSYLDRVHNPETLKIMTEAFDRANDCVPSKFQGYAHGRRKLALLILRHMERGERDPVCLAYLAALDFLR